MQCLISKLFARLINGKYVYDWKITDFCEKVGISRTYFYQIVNNEKVPTLEVAFKISSYISDFDDHNWTVEDLWYIPRAD